MKLFTKGMLLIAVPGLFGVLLLGFLLQGQRQADDATRWSLHSKEVLEQTNEVLETALGESVRFRGALLAEEPSMAPDAFWDALFQKIARLEQSVADNPTQKLQAAHLGALARAYRVALERTLQTTQDTDPATVKARYRALVKGGALNDFRAQAYTFLNEEKRLDQLRTIALAQARQTQATAMIVSLGLSLLLSIVVAWLFSKNIGGRLSVLTVNAQRLAERQALLPPIGGADEITRLDGVLRQAHQRLAQSELREALAREELHERAEKLDQVNQALTAQTQDNEMFVYSVSHDLRSPLVNLQGFGREIRYGCDDLKRRLQASALPDATKAELLQIIDEDVYASLNFLDSAVLRSAGIIDALLRLSRAGRVEYVARGVDVQGVVRRVVGALHGTLEERGAQVRIGTLPNAWADPTAVEQIFGNLVNNAVAYLDRARPGKIEIGVLEPASADAPEASEADAGAPAGANMVTYFVRDNGLGIPENLLPKLFVAFQRLHGNISPGEGIGLALVRRAVERNGGRIWVESTHGVGSSFFVTLPAELGAAGISITEGEVAVGQS